MTNPVPHLLNGPDLTERGYWDGTQLITGMNFRDSSIGLPYDPPDPVNVQKYGTSGATGTFATVVATQISQLHINCCYFYDPGQSNSWSLVSTLPSDMDMYFQTKATTKAQFVSLIASMPSSRPGKVFLHHWNEPENDVESGGFSQATWAQRCDWLFEAIDEAIAATPTKSYIKKSVELQYWTLQQWNKGLLGPNNSRNLPGYIRPGLEYIGWSNYAEKKVSNGHEVATISPVKMPQIIAKYHADHLPLVKWSSITGWAVGDAYLSDPITLENRRQWFLTASENLRVAGSQHFMWFETDWSNGDYRIWSDQAYLFPAWQDRLTSVGQW